MVARARAGDADAFEVLLRRHVRAAYLVALGQLGEHADAEDACQDAFVRAWQRLSDCRDGGRFSAWLLQIVRNTAHNRREYLTVRATETIDGDTHASSRDSPQGDLERRELANALRSALRSLRETERAVVLFHDLDGRPHKEIATLLGISEELSRRHLSDARKRLRELLGDYKQLENADD